MGRTHTNPHGSIKSTAKDSKIRKVQTKRKNRKHPSVDELMNFRERIFLDESRREKEIQQEEANERMQYNEELRRRREARQAAMKLRQEERRLALKNRRMEIENRRMEIENQRIEIEQQEIDLERKQNEFDEECEAAVEARRIRRDRERRRLNARREVDSQTFSISKLAVDGYRRLWGEPEKMDVDSEGQGDDMDVDEPE